MFNGHILAYFQGADEDMGQDEYFGDVEPQIRSVLSHCHAQNEPPLR